MYRFLILIFFTFPLFADQVELIDGSLINGKIIKVVKGKLTLKSEIIGQISISMEKVKNYKTDEPVNFKTPAGEVSAAAYDSAVHEKILTLWSGSQDPDIFENRWERLIWFNLVKKEGNNDEQSIDGGIEFKYLRLRDTLKFYAFFNNNTRNDNRTSDDYTWGGDYELRFGEKQHHSWYFRAEYEKDRIKDIELRSTYATGYGYYFIKEPDTALRGRIGLLYRTEDFIEDDSSESVGVDFGLNFEKKLFESVKWFTDITYAPAFEDFSDYRLVHESGLEIPFNLDFDLSLKTGVKHEYDSVPAEDKKNLDTRYFMRLQLKF